MPAKNEANAIKIEVVVVFTKSLWELYVAIETRSVSKTYNGNPSDASCKI